MTKDEDRRVLDRWQADRVVASDDYDRAPTSRIGKARIVINESAHMKELVMASSQNRGRLG
jgi:hypothetical protein